MLPKRFGARVTAPLATNRRDAQLAASRKKIAKPPRRHSAIGKPVSSLGIRQSHAPMVTSVSRSTPRIGSSVAVRSEEHTSELQSLAYIVCRLLLEKKKA